MRYSLRSALVVITILSIVLAFYANRVYRQRTAAQLIERIGGKVAYEYGELGAHWSRSTLRKDITSNIIGVDLSGHRTNRVILEQLGELKRLEQLSLHNTLIADSDLILLSCLSDLQALSLSGTSISDEGFSCLQTLEKLRTLDLARTNVGDSGLKHVAKLQDLEVLNLSGTAVTDAGLAKH